MQGSNKKIVADKGYGFINGEKGDIFFHHSVVEDSQFDSLQEGQLVEYEEGEGPKGSRAERVKPV